MPNSEIALKFSERYQFAEWPHSVKVPPVAAGVYAIWRDGTLVYCGMSGRGLTPEVAKNKTRYGLWTRLNSHASGRLSGDQFCVYVANRLVLPSLDPFRLPQFADGTLSLDRLTRDYIHANLTFSFVIVETGEAAMRLESKCRSGEVFQQRPLLNPIG